MRFFKNHVVNFSVETSEGVKPCWSDTGWRTWPLRFGEICRPPTANSQRSSVFHRPVRGAELVLCAFLQTYLKSSCWGRNILLSHKQWVRRNLSFRGISSAILHVFGLSLIKWWKRLFNHFCHIAPKEWVVDGNCSRFCLMSFVRAPIVHVWGKGHSCRHICIGL